MAGIGDSWGTREELLHPRDSHGRFRTKWKMSSSVLNAVLKITQSFRPRTFQSDTQATQYTQNLAHRKPERFQGGRGYPRLQSDFFNANEDLLDGNPDEPSTKRFVQMMDQSMVDIPDDIIVSQVVPPSAFGLTPDRLPELEEMTGNVIANRGYSSVNMGTPMGGGQGLITLSIATPKGTKMAIPGRSPSDREMIFNRDQELTVTKVKPDGRGGYYMWAVATPSTPGENPAPETGHAGPGKPQDREADITALENTRMRRDMGQQPADQLPGGVAAGGTPAEAPAAPAPSPAAPAAPSGDAATERAKRRAAIIGRPAAPAQETQPNPAPATPALTPETPTPETPSAESLPNAVQPPSGATATVTGNPVTSFREAMRDADLKAPLDPARRREFNSAFTGVASGKVHPEDALRDLDSDIERNKARLQGHEGMADTHLAEDIERQEKLSDLIRKHFSLGNQPERQSKADVVQDLNQREIAKAKERTRPAGGSDKRADGKPAAQAHEEAQRGTPAKAAKPRAESVAERTKAIAEQPAKDAEDDRLNAEQRSQWSDALGGEPKNMGAGDILLDEVADLLRNGRITRPKASARLRDQARDDEGPEADYLRKVADAIDADTSKPNKRVPLKKVTRAAPNVEKAEASLAGRTDKNILTGLNGLSVGDLRGLADKWGVETRGDDKKLKLKSALAKELAAKWKATPELQRKAEGAEEVAASADELDGMTVAQLKEYAKANGIKVTGALRKAQMLEAIKKQRDGGNAPEAEAPAEAPVKAVKKAAKAAVPAKVAKTAAPKATKKAAKATPSEVTPLEDAQGAVANWEAEVESLENQLNNAEPGSPEEANIRADLDDARDELGTRRQELEALQPAAHPERAERAAQRAAAKKTVPTPEEQKQVAEIQQLAGGFDEKRRLDQEEYDSRANAVRETWREAVGEPPAGLDPVRETGLHLIAGDIGSKKLSRPAAARRLLSVAEGHPGDEYGDYLRKLAAHLQTRAPRKTSAARKAEVLADVAGTTDMPADLKKAAKKAIAAPSVSTPETKAAAEAVGKVDSPPVRDMTKAVEEVRDEVKATRGPLKLEPADRVSVLLLSKMGPEMREQILADMPEEHRNRVVEAAELIAQEKTRVKSGGVDLDQLLSDANLEPPPHGSVAEIDYEQVKSLLSKNRRIQARSTLREHLRRSDERLRELRTTAADENIPSAQREGVKLFLADEEARNFWLSAAKGALEDNSSEQPTLISRKQAKKAVSDIQVQLTPEENEAWKQTTSDGLKEQAREKGIKISDAATTKDEVVQELVRELAKRRLAGDSLDDLTPSAEPVKAVKKVAKKAAPAAIPDSLPAGSIKATVSGLHDGVGAYHPGGDRDSVALVNRDGQRVLNVKPTMEVDARDRGKSVRSHPLRKKFIVSGHGRPDVGGVPHATRAAAVKDALSRLDENGNLPARPGTPAPPAATVGETLKRAVETLVPEAPSVPVKKAATSKLTATQMGAMNPDEVQAAFDEGRTTAGQAAKAIRARAQFLRNHAAIRGGGGDTTTGNKEAAAEMRDRADKMEEQAARIEATPRKGTKKAAQAAVEDATVSGLQRMAEGGFRNSEPTPEPVKKVAKKAAKAAAPAPAPAATVENMAETQRARNEVRTEIAKATEPPAPAAPAKKAAKKAAAVTSPGQFTREQLESMSLADLVEIETDRKIRRTSLRKADRIQAILDNQDASTPAPVKKAAKKTAAASGNAVQPGVYSDKPTLKNTWGGEHTEIGFHDSGIIGQAIRGMGRDRDLSVDGDKLENVLGRLATRQVRDEISGDEFVDGLKKLAARMPEGSKAASELKDAVSRLDAPKKTIKVPADTPPFLADLARKLEQIPLARSKSRSSGPGEVDQLQKLLQDFHNGDPAVSTPLRLDRALTELNNKRHESEEGMVQINRAVAAAIKELDAIRRDPKRKAEKDALTLRATS